MIESWSNLEPAMKTFMGIGIVASAVLTIQMILNMVGGAIEAPDADFDVGEGGEGGAEGIFSIRSIGAFFTGFGWAGVSMLQAGHGVGAATFVATLVGFVFLGVVLYLMRYLHSLREEGTLDYANAIGNVGSVYLPIPPNRKGLGQVEVMVQERLKIVQALTDHPEKIGNRVAVRVTEMVDAQTILVVPLEHESGPTDESGEGAE